MAGAGAKIMAKVGAGNKKFRLRNTGFSITELTFCEYEWSVIRIAAVLYPSMKGRSLTMSENAGAIRLHNTAGRSH